MAFFDAVTHPKHTPAASKTYRVRSGRIFVFMSSCWFHVFAWFHVLMSVSCLCVLCVVSCLCVGFMSSCCFQIFGSPSYLTDSGVFPPVSSLPTLSCHGIKPHIKSNTSASIENSQVVESRLDLSSRTFKLHILKHFILHHVQ